MEENKMVSKEQIYAAEGFVDLASLIGVYLRISVRILNGFDVDTKELVYEYAPSEYDGESGSSVSFGNVKPADLSEDAYIEQITSIFDPRIKEFLGDTAIYDMFQLATSFFEFDLANDPDHLSKADKKKAAIAWIIVKRAYAVHHNSEAIHLLNLPDVLAGNIVYNSSFPSSRITEEDKQFITSACALCAEDIHSSLSVQDLVFNAIKELEVRSKAARVGMLAPLSSLPNGDPLNWLMRVVASGKGGRVAEGSERNRHEKVEVSLDNGTLVASKVNKESGAVSVVSISNAEKYLTKNKTFAKTLVFALQKMASQSFPQKVGFSLQELVDLGMYSTTGNAWRAVKAFFDQQSQIKLSGAYKIGRKTIKEKGGFLFYNYELDNGYVKLSVNNEFNFDFIASSFTIFPRFAYALNNNAFFLVRYIFFVARQNGDKLKEKGSFTISLKTIQENLGLPSPEYVKEHMNRRYKQLIIDPIEEAIEEIETALETVPEARDYGFTITPVIPDCTSISEWLSGYLEIGMNGAFAQKFIEIADNAEKERERSEKERERLARAKAAQVAKLGAAKNPAQSE